MADFNVAFAAVLQLEGGWRLIKHEGDRGGMTWAGISRRANPD